MNNIYKKLFSTFIYLNKKIKKKIFLIQKLIKILKAFKMTILNK